MSSSLSIVTGVLNMVQTMSSIPAIALTTPTVPFLTSLSLELRRAIADELDSNDVLNGRLVSKDLAAGFQARYETVHLSKIEVLFTRRALRDLAEFTSDHVFARKIKEIRLIAPQFGSHKGHSREDESACSECKVVREETDSDFRDVMSLASALECVLDNFKAANHIPVVRTSVRDYPYSCLGTRSLLDIIGHLRGDFQYGGDLLAETPTIALLSAIASTVFPVHTLDLCSKDSEEFDFFNGVRMFTFEINSDLLPDLHNSLANLTTLRMGLADSDGDESFYNQYPVPTPSDNEEPMAHHSFKAAFGATTAITHLHLDMDGGTYTPCAAETDITLRRVAATLKNNKLKHVSLHTMNAWTQEYIDFLGCFRGSLTSLALEGIVLKNGYFSTILSFIHDELNLERLRLLSPGIVIKEDDNADGGQRCMTEGGKCVDFEVNGVDAVRERLARLIQAPTYLSWDDHSTYMAYT